MLSINLQRTQMNTSTLFQAANSFAMIGWLFLLIVPNWKYTKTVITTGIIVLLAVFYAFLVLKDISSFNPDSFSTLENVMKLFQNEQAVLAGWVHYLAFDLFVGTYIAENAKLLNISRWIVSPILFFTFMFGPVGFLLFFIVKTVKSNISN